MVLNSFMVVTFRASESELMCLNPNALQLTQFPQFPRMRTNNLEQNYTDTRE